MSKKKGMTPAQKAAARWDQEEEASFDGASVGVSAGVSVGTTTDGSPSKEAASARQQTKINLEGLLAPVGLIVIIAVVGFILMFNQGGFY